jgi:hypothetical protein
MHSLQSTYRTAIGALISKAAPSLKISVDDLYKKNNGRIPIWAWQVPYHNEPKISTPVPDGHSRNKLTGSVHLGFPNLNVTLLPDTESKKVKLSAETKIIFRHAIRWISKNGVIEKLIGAEMSTATIQTLYKPGVNPRFNSGYGRGTTPEDKRAAQVTPNSGTLAFHEENHGLDFLRYLSTHPFPAFKGVSGMKLSQIESLHKEWQDAIKKYKQDIEHFSIKFTDCVGVTIDEYNEENGDITMECK